MANEFEVKLAGHETLIHKFEIMGNGMHETLSKKVMELSLLLEAKVKKEHLSGPTGPHTLDHKTGLLQRSVHTLPLRTTQTEVIGGVAYGAEVPYARIHEYGGTINIPEIVPTKAKALHFTVSGKEVFAMSVKAHTVKMPERAPLRTAFAEMKPMIREQLQRAVSDKIHG